MLDTYLKYWFWIKISRDNCNFFQSFIWILSFATGSIYYKRHTYLLYYKVWEKLWGCYISSNRFYLTTDIRNCPTLFQTIHRSPVDFFGIFWIHLYNGYDSALLWRYFLFFGGLNRFQNVLTMCKERHWLHLICIVDSRTKLTVICLNLRQQILYKLRRYGQY